jgi:hypothetical protein
LRRITCSLLVAAIGAGVAALPAAGKEGVEATLATKVPLDAEPGTRLRLAWRLTYAEGRQERRPFGANGVFVRLVSASGARAETGMAPPGSYARGRYSAAVVVPDGGIGDVEVGLQGWTSGAGGTRRSDLLFPITNDPLPGSLRIASPLSQQAAPEPERGGSKAWIAVVGLASLLAVGGVSAVVARRGRRREEES